MTDATTRLLPSTEERRDKLTRELRKYNGAGFAVTVQPDGLGATLTRKRKVNLWLHLLGALLTGGIWLIVLVVLLANRKTESVVLRVDMTGRIIRG